MKKYVLGSILTASLLLGLTACKQQPAATSVAPASATSSAATDSEQVLESNDKKIRITIANGHFVSAGEQADLHPDNIPAEDLTLLQHDANQNITLYTTHLGKPKATAEIYFENLKTTLENTAGLTDVAVGAATENRMSYQFTQTASDGSLLHENCIAIYETENLYNVCANSSTASHEDLMAVLKGVALVQSVTMPK